MTDSNLPWVESPFFDEIIKSKDLSEAQNRIAKDYNKNGYVVIADLIPGLLIDKAKADIKKAFAPDFAIKTQRDQVRVQDAWKVSGPAKEIACYPELLQILKLLYDRDPIPFQTLNFSEGSQQRAHSDTVHFSSLPPKFMCGVWVAFEDTTEDNGPLFYYPGSHRLAEYDFSDIRFTPQTNSYQNYNKYEDFLEEIIEVNKIEKKKFLAKKGDVLIWSSNIVHGGEPVMKAGLLRWSQVTHYFFEDCYYYTPMLSNMVTNELFLRKRLVNIKTGHKIKQSYNGQKLKKIKTSKGLYLLTSKMPSLFNYIKGMF